MKRKMKNLRRKMAACLTAICFFNSVWADNNDINIVGTVYDINNNSPLPAATVYIEELEKGVGTVSDVQGILAKTVGVTIRATVGLGSTLRLSVRGLEGKRCGCIGRILI